MAWFIKEFHVSYDFSCSNNDPSLFIYEASYILTYFLFYVDYLLLTCNNNHFMQEFILNIYKNLSLKNMWAPHYFLGIETIPTNSGILLSQQKHIREILKGFNMEGGKPSPTPIFATTTLQLHDGTPSTNATECRSIVRALQYLTHQT